nr:F-box/FBD/LRR-repeat protein At1g13570-like [Ipomoea batatas]
MLFSAESLAVYRFHSGRSIELERSVLLFAVSITDAARIALLSTEWRDVWLRHGRLVFDNAFFFKCAQKYGGYKRMVNILDRVIIHCAAPVKKFTLSNSQSDFMLNQCDLDRWCLFLSRNGVEELSIALVVSGQKYDVPIWILSCPTIRHLNLEGFLIGCRRNAPCIFPGVTLLLFKNVEFKRRAPSPNWPGWLRLLTHLSFFWIFIGCERIETESDLISGLPVDLKERILECLPIRDVARTALLSTHWKDVCLRHGRLAFDWDFIKWVQECKLDSTTVITIIDNSLLLRVGLVKKFTLHISCLGVQLQQSDINRGENFDLLLNYVLYFVQMVCKWWANLGKLEGWLDYKSSWFGSVVHGSMDNLGFSVYDRQLGSIYPPHMVLYPQLKLAYHGQPWPFGDGRPRPV